MGIHRLRRNLRDINFTWIERARDFVGETRDARRENLGAGLVLYRTNDEIWLFEKDKAISIPGWPLIDPDTKIQMEVPGRTVLAGKWHLESRWLSSQEVNVAEIRANTDPYQAWIQPDSDSPVLTLRTRKSGDRINPLGMLGHSIKLSDYMINARLPQPVRERWPLVCLGEKIIWIPGYCVADELSVKNPDAPAILLTLKVFESDGQS
jgi:tRNA(Ile)-lysidine synthetase-like protein